MSINRHNRKNISGLNGGYSFLPQITDRTPDQFLQDIIKIQESQYTPINHVPTIFGKRINLLAMYNAVAQRGGLKKMVTELSWEGVMKDLNIPIRCANACVALRSIYQRYLEQFERLQRNKATISDIEEELQIESENRYKTVTQKSTLTHFNINPNNMVYRSDVHQINSHKRQEMGLSCDLTDTFEYRNLEMSLKSGLVNEIEFSLNTCLLMSYQNEGVQLWRNPRILTLILSSVSISDSDYFLNQSYQDPSVKKFLRFWNNTVIDEKGRKFLNPDVFVKDHVTESSLDALNQIFTINEELTIYDKEGQRIQLVATIIRNLTFDSSNGRILTQEHQCLRFVLLCCYASHFALRQLGLEILSMLKFPIYGILSDTFTHLLVDLIRSEDRVDRLRGLELISRLCDQSVCMENIDFFISLPKTFFTSLISTLIVHDLHLLVLALEAVYGLSEVDPLLCCKLIDHSSETLITLYTLLSLEAQVMGTQSLIRIRVMQGPSVIAATSNNSHSHIRSNSSTPHQNQKQLATSLMPPPPVPLHKVPISAMPVSHSIANYRTQNYITSDLINSIKPSSNQKTPTFVSKCNASVSQPPNATITIAPISTVATSVPSHTNENTPIISISNKPILSSNLNVNVQYAVPSQKSVTSIAQNTVPTSSTLSINTVKSAGSNCLPMMKTSCISTPLPTFLLESTPKTEISYQTTNNHEFLTSLTPAAQTPAKLAITTEVPTNTVASNTMINDPSIKDVGSSPSSFVNKQEFVKSWLVNNYIEFPQCTVPLFLIYKQLQIAVQNHFRDSEMVSAEEFHKLVRLLFPQVQLVQLYTPGGAVEIHYYNLKSFPKTSTLESLLESPKLKPNIGNSHDINNCNVKSNVPHLNNAQTNCIIDSANDVKSLKRHSNEIANGFSSDISQSNHVPKKKPKFSDNQIINTYQTQVQNADPAGHDPKDNHYTNSNVNGMLMTNATQNEKNYQQISEKLANESSYRNFNGSSVDDFKHSDSEMKAFSSSTVSPMHCESLANGTDGSSEGTMDSDLGKIAANIAPSGTSIVCPIEPIISAADNCKLDCIVTSTSSDDASTSDSSQQKKFKRINSSQLGRTRSRFRSNGANGKGKPRNYSNQRPYNLSYLYICEWDSCLQSFDKPQKVYGHVYTNHFMTLRTEVESTCLWAGCEDKTHRTPLPLLNHVNEQHCNNVALEAARQTRLANEKEKAAVLSPETSLSNENTSSSKQVNISATISQPKISSSTTGSPISSISYQILTQPSIPTLSMASHNSKSKTVSTTLSPATIASPIKQEPKPSIHIDSSTTMIQITKSQCEQPISTTIMSTNSPSISSQKETIILSSSNKSTPIVENRAGSQILPKVRPTNCAPTTICPPTVVIPSNFNESRHITESLGPSIKQSIKEGPVTKHIRFLSALILRNLCQNSSIARRFVSTRHQQIFEMSISGCESSMALCECLLFSSSDIAGNSENTG